MKKIFTMMAAAAVAASQLAFAAVPFNQVFPVNFANGLPSGWTAGGETTLVNGGMQVMCPQTEPNYRADLKYNMSGTNEEKEAHNILFNASEYKVLALQFVGSRPESGVLKLSNIAVEGTGWIKGTEGYSLSEQGWTDIKDLDNNHTYYWTVGGEKWTGDLTITAIEIVIADIKNSSDNSYIVSKLNWYRNVDELESTLNLKQETAVVNQNTSKGYADLASAWKNASDGDILVVNEDQTLGERLNADSRNLTVRGANPDIKITRTNNNSMIFLANKADYNITLENLVLDGNDGESSANFTEASGYAKMTFNNVTVRNAKSSNALGLVVAKGGGKLALDGISFENCVVNSDAGEVFVGSNGTTLAGNNSMKLAIEVNGNAYSLNVEEGAELTNATPIVLTTYGQADFPEGYVLVNGTTAADKFVISSATQMYVNADVENNCLVASTVSGIENIVESAEPAIYYNLQGVQVAEPGEGIFIRVQGSDVKKVLIKK